MGRTLRLATLHDPQYELPPPGAGQRRGPVRVHFSFAAFPADACNNNTNLGTWTVGELQICEMGSWAPDGAYVWVAGCDVQPERS